LSPSQIQELHRATLEVLETVGVRVDHAPARQMLEKAGGRIKDGDIVQIPEYLVEEAIRSAPSRVTIYDRLGREAMRLEGRRVYYGLGTDLLQTYDLETGQLRESCLQDIANAAIVADYCQEIDFIASNGFPHEVHKNMAFVAEFMTLVENSTKPIYFTAAGRQDLTVIADMAAAVTGGDAQLRERPFVIHYAEPLSPLVHSAGAVDKLLLCADRGIPLNYAPALLSGGGAIITANAEALSGLVMHQLRVKGAPMISGFSVTPMDMRTGSTVYGSPDERLTHSAGCDLYHYYGLPVWGEAGCSDAKTMDQQAAFESAFSILMAALDGCNLVHDIGYLGQGLIGTPAAIVMGNELISYVRRIMRGFDMGSERLAVDLIRRVGPGGNYLAEDETAAFLREEHWIPEFSNRDNPDTWILKGSPAYKETVTQKALEILNTHKPVPLPDPVAADLKKIYRKAQNRLKDLDFGV
jgi:trimethylamine--corrinoid protein Co-methyltransferase